MKSIFLRAKHWQLFIPLIAVPFVTILISAIAAFFFITMLEENTDRSKDIFWIFYFTPVAAILCGFIQFAWMWHILTKLVKLIPNHVALPVRRMKFFFFVPVMYLCLLPFYIVFAITTFDHRQEENFPLVMILGLLIFFLHLFSIFCTFHSFFFTAKTIRSAELQRDTLFSDFSGDFFLIWLFPIGVWFIQPRVNKLADDANGFLANEGRIEDQF